MACMQRPSQCCEERRAAGMGFSMAARLTVPGFDVVNSAGSAGWQGSGQAGRKAGRKAGGRSEWDQWHCAGQAQASQQLPVSHQEAVNTAAHVNRY